MRNWESTVCLGTDVDGIVGLLQQRCDLEDVLLADQVVVVAGYAVEPERSPVKCLRAASNKTSWRVQNPVKNNPRGNVWRSTTDKVRTPPSPMFGTLPWIAHMLLGYSRHFGVQQAITSEFTVAPDTSLPLKRMRRFGPDSIRNRCCTQLHFELQTVARTHLHFLLTL